MFLGRGGVLTGTALSRINHTEFIDIITENKKFLYTEFKKLPIDKQIKLLKFRSKVVEKSNMLWSM